MLKCQLLYAVGEKTEFVQNLRMVVDKGSFCAIGVTRKFQDLPLLSKVIALADEGALILQTEKETDLENFDTAENRLDREVIAVTRMERVIADALVLIRFQDVIRSGHSIDLVIGNCR